MSIRNVSYEAIATETHGGAGNGNSYNFRVTYDVEIGPKGSDVWNTITTLAHGERDVASSYKYAGQEVPAELEGPYDCYGRKIAAPQPEAPAPAPIADRGETKFVVAFTDPETGDTGYIRRLYPNAEYSMLRGKYQLRTKGPKNPNRFYRAGEEGTAFTIDEACELLAKIAGRFPANVDRWFANPRIEILNFDAK